MINQIVCESGFPITILLDQTQNPHLMLEGPTCTYFLNNGAERLFMYLLLFLDATLQKFWSTWSSINDNATKIQVGIEEQKQFFGREFLTLYTINACYSSVKVIVCLSHWLIDWLLKLNTYLHARNRTEQWLTDRKSVV